MSTKHILLLLLAMMPIAAFPGPPTKEQARQAVRPFLADQAVYIDEVSNRPSALFFPKPDDAKKDEEIRAKATK